METPVSVLMKLRTKPCAFLLESVEGGEKWGRYTFLGSNPKTIYKIRGEEVVIESNGNVTHYKHGGDPLHYLKELMECYRPVSVEGCPRFYGGAVGFFGYDMVRYFEKLPGQVNEDLHTEDAVFILTDTMIIFDNVRHTIKVVACAHTEEKESLQEIYESCRDSIDAMLSLLAAPVDVTSQSVSIAETEEAHFESNMTQKYFEDMVKKAKGYIVNGDIIQVVLSQRFQMENHIDSVDLYR
ncbi:MAG: anthranilate synthase component I, partial [Syntrophales bacterium LBB04]|nr:anthranilate synthase component I [Syntrophales bacterium LBB04]